MTRLEKLKNLEADLLELMKKANSRSYAPLAKQYRETIKEIEEIEGTDGGDEIAEILGRRDSAGKPGAVRKDRTKLQTDGRTGCDEAPSNRRNGPRSVAK